MIMVLALVDTLIRLKQGILLQRLRTVQSEESQAAVADPIIEYTDICTRK
jgi:hypothetical protein